MKKLSWLISLTLVLFISCAEIETPPANPPAEPPPAEISSPPIENFYPVPSKEQLEWQDNELVLFIHFGVNTFTGNEWGDGKEDPAIFNPVKLDANQWVNAAKEAGFKYIILTAKHHDGFCLWPSAYTEHSVKNSPYKNGKGDIVKEFAEACRNAGVKFCLYLSPWDRHEATYGTDAYNVFYQKQLTELLTNYGELGEVWLDGANGEELDGEKQNYNWSMYYATIKHFQPSSLIAVQGPDVRWAGNENGTGVATEWSRQIPNPLFHGSAQSMVWFPSECDVSIRPGWFYHDYEDSQIKSLEQLIDIYFKSVGRNSNLLLNIPPNKDGLFTDADLNRLREWRAKLNEIFSTDLFLNKNASCSNYRYGAEEYSPAKCLDNNKKTFWAADKDTLTAELVVDMGQQEKINVLKLEEAIEYGQRIAEFKVYAEVNGIWQEITSGTTIGRTRLLKFEPVTTGRIKISITNSLAAPTLRTVSAYYAEF